MAGRWPPSLRCSFLVGRRSQTALLMMLILVMLLQTVLLIILTLPLQIFRVTVLTVWSWSS